MRKFNLEEYRELKKSNVPYLVRVDPDIENDGFHDIYLFKASDVRSIVAIKNIWGNFTVTHVTREDEILEEMASGEVFGINFLIA